MNDAKNKKSLRLVAAFSAVALAVPAVLGGCSAAFNASSAPPQSPAAWSDFYHVPEGTPYHVENSIAGVRLAAHRAGQAKAIDLDWHVTRDGVVVNTHWSQPLLKDGFTDPEGKIAQDARIEDLTWADVQRLRTRDGHAIQRAETMFRLCAELGVRMEFEAKGSAAFEDPALWQSLKVLADDTGLTARGLIQVKTISTTDGAPARLAAAHEAGFTTIILPRGSRALSRQAYGAVTDYVRGPFSWG